MIKNKSRRWGESRYKYWKNPNWYHDEGWSKKRILELLKRDWKHRWRAYKQRMRN